MNRLSFKIFTNTFWQIFGRLAQAIIGLISIKLITSYLPLEVYGQYTTVFELIGFFAIIADFGLYTIGVQEMSKNNNSESFVLSHILTLRLILITLLLGSSNIIIPLIPKYAGTLVAKSISLVSLATAFVLINGTLTSLLQYRLKMHLATIAQVLGKIINIGLIAFIILILKPSNLEHGFNFLILSALGANLVMLLCTIFIIKKELPFRFHFDHIYAKNLLKTALPYGLALILMTFYFKVDIILLQYFSGNSAAGIYAVPLKLMEILSVISVFFMNSALPTLTKNFQSGYQKLNASLQNIFKVLHGLAAPILIGGVLLAFPIIFSISSPQFLSGYHCTNNSQVVYHQQAEAEIQCAQTPINQSFKQSPTNSYFYQTGSDIAFKIILIGLYFSFLNTIFAFSLVATDRNTTLLKINFTGFLINVVLNLIFIPKYGILAASTTTAFCELCVFMLAFYCYKQHSGIQLNLKTLGKTYFASILMGGFIYLLQPITYSWMQNLNLLLIIPSAACFYFISMHMLGAINLKKLKTLRNV